MGVTIHQGDCLDVLRCMEADSVDAVVTDPPYGLSKHGSRQDLANRLFDSFVKVGFPDLEEVNFKSGTASPLFYITGNGSFLAFKDRAIGVSSGIGVPVRAVDLQSTAVGNHEISNREEPAGCRVSDGDLPLEDDPEPGHFLGDFILKIGDMPSAAISGNLPDCCLPEFFQGGFAVPIFAGSPSSSPRSFGCSGSVKFGDHYVGGRDDSLGNSVAAPGIVALPGTVNTLMLRFDNGGRPFELCATRRADERATLGYFGGAELIRADPAASGLSSVAQPFRVGIVLHGADGARLPDKFIHVWVPKKTVSRILPKGGFMGKDWDSALPDPEIWAELLRVMKPGAHLLSFGGTRTYHRMVCAIEDAGFEIRDCVMWLHGQGFPKSLNLNGEWKGWGTALKPAYEPIVMARKPCARTVAANVDVYGTGALNIDACRVDGVVTTNPRVRNAIGYRSTGLSQGHSGRDVISEGRWPANVTHDGSAEVLAGFVGTEQNSRPGPRFSDYNSPGSLNTYGGGWGRSKGAIAGHYDDTGSAARFFYCAKASKADREEGLTDFPSIHRANGNKWTDQDYRVAKGERTPSRESGPRRNHHPTCKSTELMRWLCRLITPPGGIILDPFMGSGSTGKAAVIEGFSFIGIEREAEYVEIARARISYAQGPLFAEAAS